MKAEEIRDWTFPAYDNGVPSSTTQEFIGTMLQEIAAQLAELNETLKQRTQETEVETQEGRGE